jgi:hypothetical protein
MFLRNVGIQLQVQTALQPRKPHSTFARKKSHSECLDIYYLYFNREIRSRNAMLLYATMSDE